MTPMPFLNGGTHTTGSGLNFRAEPIAQRLASNPDHSQIFNSADPWRSVYASVAGVSRRYRGVPSAPYAHERDDDLDAIRPYFPNVSGMPGMPIGKLHPYRYCRAV